MAAKSIELRTLKDCLQFLEWFKGDTAMQGKVAKELASRYGNSYNHVSVTGSLPDSFSAFLTNVSTFYHKLAYKATAGNYRNNTAKDVTAALLECTPKLLAALYFLLYHVDEKLGAVGGGDWADKYPGYEETWQAWYNSYADYGGGLQQYLRVQFSVSYDVITGGFEEEEVRYNDYYKGYVQGKNMVSDLERILSKKNGHNDFRDVFVTSMSSKSGFQNSNVANVISLVQTFCQIVKTDQGGTKLKEKLEEELKGKCINWPELVKHCNTLDSVFSGFFNDKAFSYTGQAPSIRLVNQIEFAKRTAQWFRDKLGKVRENVEKIRINYPTDRSTWLTQLQPFANTNIFPYGFTFGNTGYGTFGSAWETLPPKWNDTISMLQKANDGLDKLRQLLEGEGCKPPPAPPQPPQASGSVAPTGSVTMGGKGVQKGRTPGKTTPESSSSVTGKGDAPKTEAKKPEAAKPTAAKTATPSPGGKPNGGPNRGTTGKGANNRGSSNNAPQNQNAAKNGGKPATPSVGTSSTSKPSGSAGAAGPPGPQGEKGKQVPGGSQSTKPVASPAKTTVQSQQTPSPPQPSTPPQAPGSSGKPGDGSGSPNGGGGLSQKPVSPQPSAPPHSPSVQPSGSQSPGASGNGGGKGLPAAGKPGGNGQDSKGGGPTGKQPAGASSSEKSQPPTAKSPDLPSSSASAPGSGSGPGGQATTPGTTQQSNQHTLHTSTAATTTVSSGSPYGAGAGTGGGGGVAGGGGRDAKADAEAECSKELKTECKTLIKNITKAYEQKKEKKNNDAKKWQERWDELQEENYKKIQQQKFNQHRLRDQHRTRGASALSNQDGLFAPVPSTQPTSVPPGRGRDYYELVDGSRRTPLLPDSPDIFADGEAIEDPSFQARQEKVDRRTEAEQKRNALRWQVDQQALSNMLQIEQTKSDAYEKDAKTKWDEMQRIHFLNSVQHETSLGGHPVDEVYKDPGRHDRLMERLYQENEDNITRDYMSDQERLKNRQKQDANQNMDAVRRWEEEQKNTFLTYFQNQNQNLATASVYGHPIKPELPDPRNGPQVLMYPEIELTVVDDNAKRDFAKSGLVTQDIKQYHEQQKQRDDFADKRIQLKLDKEIKEASDAQQKGVKQAEDIAKKEYLHNRFHGGYIDILPRNNRLDDNDHPPKSHLDLQIYTRKLPPPLDLSEPVDPVDDPNVNDIDDVIPTEAAHKTIDFTFDDPFSVHAPKVTGISRVPPNPDDFKTRKLNVPLFSDPTKCQNPWYVPSSLTSTTLSTASPPPVTDHLPLPRTVREMLYWFVGLNQYGFVGRIADHLENLFKDFKGDAIEVTGDPNQLTSSLVTAKLTEACLYSASVLYKIKHTYNSNAFKDFFKDPDKYAFYYSLDPAYLLCQLRDYAYACHHQLMFLKAQCNRDMKHCGWKNDEYGSDITASKSPLQSFLTDGWDCTFETHLFDPCNLCLKSRVRMGFKRGDLPSSQQTGATLAAILTPSCGGDDPLMTLASYLNCLTRRTPRTTGELVSYFHHFGNELHGYVSGLSPLGESLSTSHADCPDWDQLGASDLQAVRGIRGTDSLMSKHNSNHSNDHPNTLSTLVGCGSDPDSCHPHCSPITYRAYALYSQSFVHTYLSWSVYLPDRLHESLQKLHYDLQKHRGSSKCSSLHLCSTALPLLYSHGFTPPEVGSQVSLKCSDVISKLKEIVNGKPIASLMTAMDNFLYRVREPFIYTLVALWSLAFLIFANTMLYRLDVLRIRSHLLRSKASHRIDVKALLTKGRKMLSLYKEVDYFDEDPIGQLVIR